MYVQRSALIHIELSKDTGSPAGAVLMCTEEPDGQFGLPRSYEVGPFDVALDVAIWLRNAMLDEGLLHL